jgi:Polyketide cyclase / dehydrase and lipid transport
MEQATLTIPATPTAIRAVLLDPLALPLWNEAFLAIDGPSRPLVGRPYALRVRPGLSGHLEYTAIESDRIEITWQIPGFHEIGTWTITDSGEVLHTFTHTGPLAAVLRPAYRGIASVRLDRLARRVTELSKAA